MPEDGIFFLLFIIYFIFYLFLKILSRELKTDVDATGHALRIASLTVTRRKMCAVPKELLLVCKTIIY